MRGVSSLGLYAPLTAIVTGGVKRLQLQFPAKDFRVESPANRCASRDLVQHALRRFTASDFHVADGVLFDDKSCCWCV